MGRDDWQPQRVSDAYVLIIDIVGTVPILSHSCRYNAAQQSGLDFKLFLSLDMA